MKLLRVSLVVLVITGLLSVAAFAQVGGKWVKLAPFPETCMMDV